MGDAHSRPAQTSASSRVMCRALIGASFVTFGTGCISACPPT